MKNYKLKFKINDTVYVKVDRKQLKRKVVKIIITEKTAMYQVKPAYKKKHFGDDTFFGIELSRKKWELKRIAFND